MRTADAHAVVAEPGVAPVRIRHLLLFGLLGLAAWVGVPRARAAWELHALGSTFADYALCMVGPTGPAALRDNPSVFWRLVRRRLVTAPAEERPFGDCAAAAGEITGSVSTRRAHLAVASDFIEYGGSAADRAAQGSKDELSLSSLLVTTRPLARLSELAKPFVQGGYTRLVKPSSHAKEAVHAVELPRPAIGRGLPSWGALYEAAVPAGESRYVLTMGQGANRSVYRSDDGGISWRVASLGEPDVRDVAARCPAGTTGGAFLFGLSEDRRFKTVRSLLPDGSESRARLVPRSVRVFAASCDEDAAVVATGSEGSRDVEVLVCRFQGSCTPAKLPRVGNGSGPRYPVDVARVHGITVVSTVMHGIVRVASSRDDGKTWTPWSVAYDPAAHPGLGANPSPPVQMIALGERILLYGGGDSPADAYPALFSDDFGASWRGR